MNKKEQHFNPPPTFHMQLASFCSPPYSPKNAYSQQITDHEFGMALRVRPLFGVAVALLWRRFHHFQSAPYFSVRPSSRLRPPSLCPTPADPMGCNVGGG